MTFQQPLCSIFKQLAVAAIVAMLVGAPVGDPNSTALAGKGNGKGGGNGANGGAETVFFRVTLGGDLQWQAIPGDASTTPLSINGEPTRVAKLDSLNFLVGPASHGDCMPHLDKWNWARTNLNFLADGVYTEGNLDGCAPVNVNGVDRVYGGVLVVQNPATDFLNNNTSRDIQLNFTPDDITYHLHYSVIGSTRDISGGLDAALRELNEGDSLVLTLGGWELEPNKNRKNRTECVGSGFFNVGTTITITRDSTPCDP